MRGAAPNRQSLAETFEEEKREKRGPKAMHSSMNLSKEDLSARCDAEFIMSPELQALLADSRANPLYRAAA